MKRRARDRGAAAVEFALVLPVLLVLLLGVVEFGRAYNIQTTLSAAAREGVRVMALESSVTEARAATKTAALPMVDLSDGQIAVSPTSCVVTGTSAVSATVTVTYPMTFITNFFGTTITLTGTGVMRCNG